MTDPHELRHYHDPGMRVGSYVIDDEIGRGGMGVVYRAHRADTGQTVALKLMLPELVGSPRFRDRFVREAELMPKLDHPNIVPVFETGETDGELFIAMRLVEGVDLKKLVESEGPLAPKRLVWIARQVASALDAAHESGVVHRDVKPQNILITTDGNDKDLVYVTDFGLVKPAGSESTASRTGQVLGSIQYMSPEQVEGMATDGRADVYSLGCVLFECLTGKIPFDRPNEVAVLWAHVHEIPPRITDVNRSLPGGLDIVIANALAKHPDDRYLTCGELVDELEKGLTKTRRPLVMPRVRPLVARIPRPKTEREVWAPNYFPELTRVKKLTMRGDRTKLMAILGAAALLLGVLQVTYDGGIPQAAADTAGVIGEVADDITGADESSDPDEGAMPGPASSPAGERSLRHLLPAGDDADLSGLSRSGEAARGSEGPSAASGGGETAPSAVASREVIAWVAVDRVNSSNEPSGRAPSDIWIMNADGSNKTRLTRTRAREYSPAWTPDGKHIIYVRDHDLWAMNRDGSNQQNLGLCPGNTDLCGDPEVSPDGRWLAFFRGKSIVAVELRTAKEITLSFLRNHFYWELKRDGLYQPEMLQQGPTWSPTGTHVMGTCAENSNAVCKGSTRSDQMRLVLGKTCQTLSWSPTGNLIAARCDRPSRPPTIWLFKPDGSNARALHMDGGFLGTPDWSPDGTRIVFTHEAGPRSRVLGQPAPTHLADISVVHSDGTGLQQLTTSTEYDDIMPAWWGPST